MLVLVVHMCHNWVGLLCAFLFPVLWEDFQVRSSSDSLSPMSKVCGVFISWYHLSSRSNFLKLCVCACMCMWHTCMHVSQDTPGGQRTTFGKSVLFSCHLGSKDWTAVIRNLLSHLTGPVEVILSIILWNDTLHFFGVVFFVCLFYFLRRGLFILPCPVLELAM